MSPDDSENQPQNCGRVPTILDNREGNTVLSALQRLLPCATNMHVATGTFEIGSLLALDEQWQALEKVRIIMGNETTKCTQRELVPGRKIGRAWRVVESDLKRFISDGHALQLSQEPQG